MREEPAAWRLFERDPSRVRGVVRDASRAACGPCGACTARALAGSVRDGAEHARGRLRDRAFHTMARQSAPTRRWTGPVDGDAGRSTPAPPSVAVDSRRRTRSANTEPGRRSQRVRTYPRVPRRTGTSVGGGDPGRTPGPARCGTESLEPGRILAPVGRRRARCAARPRPGFHARVTPRACCDGRGPAAPRIPVGERVAPRRPRLGARADSAWRRHRYRRRADTVTMSSLRTHALRAGSGLSW